MTELGTSRTFVQKNQTELRTLKIEHRTSFRQKKLKIKIFLGHFTCNLTNFYGPNVFIFKSLIKENKLKIFVLLNFCAIYGPESDL